MLPAMAAQPPTESVPQELVSLPALTGRVAVLGGTNNDKTALLVGLAARQMQQHGIVLCVDARHYRPTEVQFRLLLRGQAAHLLLPVEEVPPETTQTVLSILSRGLAESGKPAPLLLLDSVRETPDWEHTLSFLLKAGTTVVEFLRSPAEFLFGRYDTAVLLRSDAENAEAISRAVGRKVSGAELAHLPGGEGVFIHFADVRRVKLPGNDV